MEIISMKQLREALLGEIEIAMQSASDNINNDIQENLSEFYTQGSPKKYVRTYNLGNSAERTPVSRAGNTVSFEAKLNTTRGYTTGTFSKTRVLEAAENQEYGVLGKPGFWKKSEGNMQKRLDDAMGSRFS